MPLREHLRTDPLSVLDPGVENALQTGRITAQVDAATAVDVDQARLGPRRLRDVLDGGDVDAGPGGVLLLGEVDGQLAGLEQGLRGRIATALGAQDDVASG